MKVKLYKPVIGIIILLFTFSCKIEPQAIEYGKDQCNFCVMNIVDNTYAAQYVTSKGKQFKFDAVECLVNDLIKKDKEGIAIILVANYSNPGEMIDAKSAFYLISPAIKSPMGENLSAFNSQITAEEYLKMNVGEIYTWESLNQYFINK
ncbi:nitrous oxide reductase accessory protein NosL [Lutibacter sp.]|uniref:nitrous oxide reductase accessory protein NosL n=1 Tax=Lutibacter sp. TaxID=1925666 RepID=UPI00273763A4|nr:nitrous oxide reductase accessory protein NosL [Lutibacter sp.]MDP3313637.1 nitrous oxide reductase accessory protein NosL [Lutibacter sp.]